MSSRPATRALFAALVIGIGACTWIAGRPAEAFAIRERGRAVDDPGERVYEQHCRRCHGSEGRGTSQAPSLVPFEWSYEEARDLIRHPKCDMPPVPESAVSDAEIAQIVSYLKSIK